MVILKVKRTYKEHATEFSHYSEIGLGIYENHTRLYKLYTKLISYLFILFLNKELAVANCLPT